jgi:hypothetical protein
MDVHMLDRDLLLALVAVAVERFEQHGVGARQLVRLGEVLAQPDPTGRIIDHHPRSRRSLRRYQGRASRAASLSPATPLCGTRPVLPNAHSSRAVPGKEKASPERG